MVYSLLGSVSSFENYWWGGGRGEGEGAGGRPAPPSFLILIPFVTFTRNEVRGTQLVFRKRRFQGFISEILRVLSPGEKLIFSTPLGQPKFKGVSDFLCILMLSF